MMELTKKQRNEIYRLAFDIFTHEDSQWDGLCAPVNMAANFFLGDAHHGTLNSTLYPELYAFGPKETEWNRTALRFWWPRKDRETRINVLTQIIEQTNGNE